MLILIAIIIALISGVLCFLLSPQNKMSNILLLLNGLFTIGASLLTMQKIKAGLAVGVNYTWLTELNSSFALAPSKLGILLCLLSGLCFTTIALITHKINITKTNTFYGLCLFSLVGLLGVFTAYDGFVFYIFWEIALIPVYFLCSMWGDENRVKVSFKFFIYTFVGSLIMLLGLIYLQQHAPGKSFNFDSLIAAKYVLSASQQQFLFWMLFIAFAIKMPIFPLHTWQPDTYQQTFTPVTMILSAVMVKMGLFGVYTWIMPLLPDAFINVQSIIFTLCIVGIIYGSCLAMVQKDIKKLVAYSSIAHIALMCAALFSNKDIGIQGSIIQMFAHGVNILGMWMCVYFIERHFCTRDLSKMGGMANTHQSFTIFFVLIALANIALPLTNGFVGEFMMFNGLYNSGNKFNILFTVLAGLGVILSAVYTLGMVQKVAYGESNSVIINKLTVTEWIAFLIVAALILIFGFYPQPLINFIS